jgi:hypothetical protein
MIRPFEKTILEDIHFVKRFIHARNVCVKHGDPSYIPSRNDIDSVLLETGYRFVRFKNQYTSDVNDEGLTFRVIFDIKDDSVLTYIFMLKDGEFIKNGLTQYGFMLNSFDLTGVEVKPNFGFNTKEDFSTYIRSMLSIFEDFKREFIQRGGQTLD